MTAQNGCKQTVGHACLQSVGHLIVNDKDKWDKSERESLKEVEWSQWFEVS